MSQAGPLPRGPSWPHPTVRLPAVWPPPWVTPRPRPPIRLPVDEDLRRRCGLPVAPAVAAARPPAPPFRRQRCNLSRIDRPRYPRRVRRPGGRRDRAGIRLATFLRLAVLLQNVQPTSPASNRRPVDFSGAGGAIDAHAIFGALVYLDDVLVVGENAASLVSTFPHSNRTESDEPAQPPGPDRRPRLRL